MLPWLQVYHGDKDKCNFYFAHCVSIQLSLMAFSKNKSFHPRDKQASPLRNETLDVGLIKFVVKVLISMPFATMSDAHLGLARLKAKPKKIKESKKKTG